MLQTLIYKSKRLIHHYPRLYLVLYSLATFNLDYLLQSLNRSSYHSKFGGLWTDHKNFKKKLKRRLQRGKISEEEAKNLEIFSDQGYLILEKAVPAETIDRYLDDLQALQESRHTPLRVTSIDLEEPVQYSNEVHENYLSLRVVDDYCFLGAARDILFNDSVVRYVELLFDKPAVLTQSLNFLHGSQQGVHRDTSFVRMNSPMKLLGVWVALEEVGRGSGELVYFPGSHRWGDYVFNGYFKHYDAERDGEAALADNYRWLYREAERRGVAGQPFMAEKGDVLIWHADLAHGGANVTSPRATRRSLVGHFCPVNVRPLYHYYKLKHRRIYRDGDRRYMSSHYGS